MELVYFFVVWDIIALLFLFGFLIYMNRERRQHQTSQQ
jgi:hypothetical protein